MDHLQRLQRQDAGDAGTRLRGPLRAGEGGNPATAIFTNLDGTNGTTGYGDIPATAIVVSDKGTIYVGNDFGVVRKQQNQPVWHETAAGLPNVTVADLVLVPERGVLYAGTHGQGVWQFKVH